MSTQAPQLDKGEMAAAERANLRLSEQIMVLMVKALRGYAKQYPPKLQKSLSDTNAETNVDVSMGNEKLLSATLGADNKIKETRTNTLTDEQAQKLQTALSKQQGEMLDAPGIRDMLVLVNGVPLFEAKDGKVLGNNLPPEFQKAIAQMVQPKPLEIAVSTNPPKQATQQQQESQQETNSISNATPTNPPKQSPQTQQSSPAGTNSISNATPTNSPKQATQEQQQAPAATNQKPDVAQKQSNTPTAQQEQLNHAAKSTNPPKQATQQQQETPTGTKPIPNVAQNQSNPPTASQEQLNRALIAEAKKSLDRMVPADQNANNRQWKHEKYTVTQKDGVTSVYVAETKATIRQEGNAITGNARQKDVEALSTVNATIDQQLGKSTAKQTGLEL